MSSPTGHWPIVCFFANLMDLIVNGVLLYCYFGLDKMLILRGNRVMVWCLCWCVYMPYVTMNVHLHLCNAHTCGDFA